MTTDTKKESAPQDAPPVVAAGDGGKPRRLRAQGGTNAKRRPLFLIVILVIIATASYFIYTSIKNMGVVFSIDGRNYTRSQVDQLTQYPVKVAHMSKDTAAKNTFEALKEVRVAEKLGYVPPQNQINDQKNTIYKNLQLTPDKASKYQDWFNLIAEKNAIDANADSDTTPGYAGYSYVFYYGQHIQSIPDYPVSGLNDPKLIAQDRQFARSKADYYHKLLQQNRISPKDALSQAAADMQTRGHNVANTNYNVAFSSDPGQNWANAVLLPSIVNYISAQTKTGLSDIQTGQALNAPSASNGKKVDMYYYFVYLTAAPNHRSVSSRQFEQALASLPASYRGYK